MTRWNQPCAALATLALLATAAGAQHQHPAAPAAAQHSDETPASADGPDSGVELLGKPAPRWSFERWVRYPQGDLASLRGKVVLLRWWTEGCPYCKATLPELERLRNDHARDGLVIVGAFHPKPPHPVSDRHVIRVAEKLGFHGPLALDQEWTTLDRYWFDGHPERNWTSVSFLMDREGKIRWVHGGGEYHHSDDPRHHRCDMQMRELEEKLAQVLAAKTAERAAGQR